ncbi:MAG: AsmA family protein [Candidatus Abyssobacteria bacterium SURF_17]|uniref:AsmA family protein n=1 Tax=Candidatus Abyssobacteria bacterium SURF_17 TaxID=2093361 RepID=A0A419F885_9BACT|nr:MAG: AsmA family protein [Candidatus Abyssubacteria bacterium SURF_17]
MVEITKYLKWILLAVLLLISVVLVAVYVVLSRYDYNKLKPMVTQAVMDSTGRKLELTGDIKLDFGLRPALYVEGVSFENALWGSRPQLATAEQIEVQVALLPLLRKKIDAKRVVLIKPDILIETNESGESNLSFAKTAPSGEAKKAKTQAELPKLRIDEVRIEDGHFVYKDGQSKKTYEVVLATFTAVPSRKRGTVEIDARGAYNKTDFETSGSVGTIAKLLDAKQKWPVHLEIMSGDTSIALEGSIRDVMKAKGIDMSVAMKGQSTQEIARLTGAAAFPELGQYTAQLTLTDPRDKTYALSDLRIVLGENDLTGSGQINLAASPPFISATFESQKLDLRPLLGGETETDAQAEHKPRKEKVFSDKPLPLTALDDIDAHATVKVGQVLLPTLALNELAAEIELDGGHLKMKPLKATVGGGSFEGALDLRAGSKVADVAFDLDVERMNLGQMLEAFDSTDVADGTVNADIELTGNGDSVAAIMAGLDGKTVVVMGEGRINNGYLDLFGGDIRAGFVRLLNPFEQQSAYTEINCFVSRFDIRDGIARSAALVCDTDKTTVVGEGTVNLKTEQIDLSLKPSPKEGVGAGGVGKVTFSLGELTKPFKLGGTLAHPKLVLDPTQTALTVGKAAGGVVLFGPIGIAAALASGGNSGDENPCLAAIEAAEKGVKTGESGESKSAVQRAGESVTEGTKSVVEGTGRTLKKIFGR